MTCTGTSDRSLMLCAVFSVCLFFAGCGDTEGPDVPDPVIPQNVQLLVQVSLSSQAITQVSVVVTATDITTPLAFNLTLNNGEASGTITIPTGSARTITVHCYNAADIETHRGSTTVNVTEDSNSTVTITAEPLTGDQPVDVRIGTLLVTVAPSADTLAVGDTARLSATVVDALGETLDVTVLWATLKPALATVDTLGLVSALAPGEVQIVATYGGAGDDSEILVFGPPATMLAIVSQDPTGSELGGSEGEIYTIYSNGMGLTRLTDNDLLDHSPALSPDGTMIAFASRRDATGHFEDIWVMESDGSNPTNLTANYGVIDGNPKWSADGSKIVFISDRDYHAQPEGTEIYVMDADGTNETRITNNTVWDYAPVWSPDGSAIAFHSTRSSENHIWVMNADGSNETQLTAEGGNYEPAWSPDDEWIAFTSDRDGNGEIYVMRADGSEETRLTSDPGADGKPTWSPDGSQIAFQSDRSGAYQVYVMNADGSYPIPITNLVATTWLPGWRN
ncbi:DPP IV N-terminal domain-containing protein [Gemmatimonadota bacterium]